MNDWEIKCLRYDRLTTTKKHSKMLRQSDKDVLCEARYRAIERAKNANTHRYRKIDTDEHFVSVSRRFTNSPSALLHKTWN